MKEVNMFNRFGTQMRKRDDGKDKFIMNIASVVWWHKSVQNPVRGFSVTISLWYGKGSNQEMDNGNM